MYQKRKPKYSVPKRYAPSPILQVSEANSTSFDTTANTIKPLQIFDYLSMKRKCYAFQLLKQFFLFPDSSQDSYSDRQDDQQVHKPKINMQRVQMHLSTTCSVIKRVKQKLLLSAYDQMKKRYFKKKMIYRNKQYINQLVQKINNLILYEHQQVLQYVFTELIQNLKVCKLKQMMQKNLQRMSTPEHIEYEDKTFRTKEYLPFHSDEQSGIMKNDTQSFLQSDSRIQIAKDFGIRKFKNESMQTPQKQPLYNEQLPTTRHRTKNHSNQTKKQLIYIVGSSRKPSTGKKLQPTRHIKIPIETSNIDIVRIEQPNIDNRSEHRYAKRLSYFRQANLGKQLQDCSQCEYCQRLKLNQQALIKFKISR